MASSPSTKATGGTNSSSNITKPASPSPTAGSGSPAATAPPVPAGTIRVVCQQVLSAKLLVDNISKTVDIRSGVIFYVSFIGAGIRLESVDQAVSSLITGKVFTFWGPTDVSSPLPPADATPKQEEGGNSSPTTSPGGSPGPGRQKPFPVFDAGVDVLVIPQATLAGKFKGKNVQYHAQAPKDEGQALYQRFCEQLRSKLLTPDVISTLDVNGVPSTAGGSGDGEQQGGEKGQKKNGGRSDAGTTSSMISTGRRVYSGTYGNRQALQLDSYGPMTHLFEFSS